jgi:LmbE family N-acetylglucosaminyl deacetylase
MNILAFFAHPDDETILIGGTLALLARSGARVHYLSATRGEGGEVGEPPLCREAKLAAQSGNGLCCQEPREQPTFFDYIDPWVPTSSSILIPRI